MTIMEQHVVQTLFFDSRIQIGHIRGQPLFFQGFGGATLTPFSIVPSSLAKNVQIVPDHMTIMEQNVVRTLLSHPLAIVFVLWLG